jgi:hypothetical protein
LDVKEVHQQILQLLPKIPALNEDGYRKLLDGLEEQRNEELLVLFVSDQISEFQNSEMKKMATLHLADCSMLADGCEGLRLGQLPKLVLFKREGNMLIHYGRF